MKYSVSILVPLFSVISLVPVNGAFAAEKPMVACIAKNSGAVNIRSRCSASERKLSLASLQVAAQAGPKGEIGVQGFKGDQGVAGINGVNGLNGIAGIKGDKGDRGELGLVGANGVTGATGATGLTGSVGAQGPIGAIGAAGAQGGRGEMGPVGPVGAQGSVGLVGSVGQTGATGVTGATGATGATGPRGLSAFNTIPAGTSVYGAVGGDFHSGSSAGEWGATASMMGIPPVSFNNTLVVIRNNSNVDNNCANGSTCLSNEELSYQQYCGGSVEAPSASPGWICIYPTAAVNATQLRALAVPNGTGSYGFTVKWVTATSGPTIFRGVWAYTAP